ncbi:MAG: NINE protein [Alphaproteobacteria bacterium]|nr:MAG: NINE protein [Alphaproteobacteria bacterium]
MKFCSGCGKPVHKTARSCPNCGARQRSSKGGEKSKIVAGILALFLGGLGIHKFYLGQNGWGVIYLIFFWTFIPAIIAFFEAIILLVMNEDRFDEKFNS